MTEIKEFQPLVYNLEKLNKLKIDFKDVVCPPYDVISPQQHRVLLRKKYNFVKLELPTGKGNEKYKNAKRTLSLWLRSKILIKQKEPAVYIYQHKFSYPEETDKFYTRTGIFCLVSSDLEYKTIFPHEETKPKPLEDRLKLISTLNIQTSPPFFLVEDEDKKFYTKLLDLANKKFLFLELKDTSGNEHRVYRIVSGMKELNWIKNFVKERNLYIADGHHRYKVTCEYLKNVKKQYLMGYICSLSDEGLLILPTHRAVAGKYIIEGVKKFFDISEWDGRTQPKILFYCEGEFKVLKLKHKLKNVPKILSDLPYVVLNETIFKNFSKEQIFYHQDMKEIVSFADKYNGCAFILPPVSKEEFLQVVKNKLVFPPKTTYFYPKVISGIFCYGLDE